MFAITTWHYSLLLRERDGLFFLLISSPPFGFSSYLHPHHHQMATTFYYFVRTYLCLSAHTHAYTYQQSRYWIQYAEFELKHHHFTEVEAIFQRCLRSVLSVDLWKYYLNYIRRINTGPESKDIITKSYDFVLQHVGLDRDSGPIWSDYLFFLKSGQVSCPCLARKETRISDVYHDVDVR